MKKLFLVFALMLAGGVFADTRGSYVFVGPETMLNGDGFTRPPTAATGTGPYLELFKANTVLSLSPTTGITMTANIIAPTSIKAGGSARFGVVAIYQAVTNSAGLSATTKVQSTTYSDSVLLTATATTAYAEVFLNDAGQYGRPTMVDLGTITNVYPGNIIQIQITRSTGSNAVLSFYAVYAIFEPVKGWLW